MNSILKIKCNFGWNYIIWGTKEHILTMLIYMDKLRVTEGQIERVSKIKPILGWIASF